MFHTTNIRELQKKWPDLYAGCVWKTTLATDHPLYTQSVRMAEILVSHGVGIIHGGYEDGKWWWTMQAYAQWASHIIKQKGLDPSYNIWVPEARFDAKWWVQDRTKFDTVFCDPQPHMDQRCGTIIDASDMLVVNPLAGNGTIREVFTWYERNDIHKPNNLWQWKIWPMILFWDHWKELFTLLDNNFAIGTRLKDDSNMYFVNSLEEFEEVVKDIVSIINSKKSKNSL